MEYGLGTINPKKQEHRSIPPKTMVSTGESDPTRNITKCGIKYSPTV